MFWWNEMKIIGIGTDQSRCDEFGRSQIVFRANGEALERGEGDIRLRASRYPTQTNVSVIEA